MDKAKFSVKVSNAFAILILSGLSACLNIDVRAGSSTAGGSSTREVYAALCKTSGEKIHRIVEDVDGIFLMKLRPEGTNFSDQYEPYDPYGNDLSGKGYIISFLKNHHNSGWDSFTTGPVGYSFVEALDPNDNKLYRYTGQIKVTGRKDSAAPAIQEYLRKDPKFDINNYGFVLEREWIPHRTARYGVNYKEISTRSHRDQWIAGSALQIVDLDTNEVLAERIGYMMDPGAGARAGGRSPWLIASRHACPSFGPNGSGHLNQAFNFTKKSLKPKLDRQ